MHSFIEKRVAKRLILMVDRQNKEEDLNDILVQIKREAR